MTGHPRKAESARAMTGNARGQNYEFVLRGEVGDHFGLVFEGMRLERIHGNTVLSGSVIDQTQLHGLLVRIQELGMELVSVNPLDEPRISALRHDHSEEVEGVRDGDRHDE